MAYIPKQSDTKKVEDIVIKVNNSIKDWSEYFEQNIRRYKDSMRRNFVDSVSDEMRATLSNNRIAVFSCNEMEAYISRIRGDISFTDMGVQVEQANEINSQPSQAPELFNAIFEKIWYNSDIDTVNAQTTMFMLGGGWSVVKAKTKYVSDDSFSTEPYVEAVADPTLCGFDVGAKKIHKGDGEYCFQFIPYTEEDFESEFGFNPRARSKGYSSTCFPWQANIGGKPFYYVCDFYCKVADPTFIYKMPPTIAAMSGKNTMTASEYREFKQSVPANSPVVIPDLATTKWPKRKSQNKSLFRYKVHGEQLLEEATKLESNELPLIFIDGNSVTVNGKQTTRSYTYNIQEAQEVKDVLYSVTIDGLLNQGKAQIMMPEAGLPTDEKDLVPYQNPQVSYPLMVYKDYDAKNGRPVAPPSRTTPEPISQELLNEKDMSRQLMANALGSYDAQQGNIGGSGSDISGKAILAGAAQSNNASKPYLVNFTSCYRQIIKALMDLIPLCYRELSVFTVKDSIGQESKVTLNGSAGLQYADLAPNKYNVYVSLGSSFEAQREKSLETLTSLSQSNPMLQQILAGQGLPFLLKNVEINGKSELIAMVEQQLEQQQNQPPQPDPAMMKVQAQMEANQNTAIKNANDFNIAQQDVNLRGQEIGIKAMATHGKVSNETARTQIKQTVEANNAASDMEGINLEREKMSSPTPDAKLDFMESMHGN